ncbi:MAG: ribonucleotide-diphosphate reductase subunit beta [Piscirickettsiaceae bacterium]|nr:ribonucleotide-diphosphate reductase subunit beta [Piscirickettsiaceae bacterium]
MTEEVQSAVNARRVIEGPKNDLMQVRPVKHAFARDILKTMMANTWFPDEVDLTDDAKQFALGTLSDGEIDAYKKALAFLSNLDGIQLNNLVNNINRHVTSPEINQCLVRQAWDEALHVESYAQMIETIGFDPKEVYWMFETDEILAKKNQHVMSSSLILGKGFSPENFVLAIAANVALEGIYFYNGFLTFYTLARMGKMKGSAKMIKFIQRDEVGHLHLHLNIWNTLRLERPELFTPELIAKVYDLFRHAVNFEADWGKYIIEGGVLGLNDTIQGQFPEYLCDLRLTSMGLDKIYGTENPVPWFDTFSQINDAEQNFFETKVDAYSSGDLQW